MLLNSVPEPLLVERQRPRGDKVGHPEVVYAELLVPEGGDVALLGRLQVMIIEDN